MGNRFHKMDSLALLKGFFFYLIFFANIFKEKFIMEKKMHTFKSWNDVQHLRFFVGWSSPHKNPVPKGIEAFIKSQPNVSFIFTKYNGPGKIVFL